MRGWTLAIVCLTAIPAFADDWPQYRGPNRDGHSAETGLKTNWTSQPPALRWTFDLGGVGYSGPAVVGNRIFIACGRGNDDVLIALDQVKDGPPKEAWSVRIGPLFQWKGNSWNRGPNATPTVAGDTVFAVGGFGDLIAVDAASGKEKWRKSLPRDLGGEVNPIGGGLEEPTPLGWGYASAPLVDGDHVIVVPGGKQGLIAALDRGTGKTVWQSKEITDQAPYASPVLTEVGGVRQVLLAVNAGMVGVAASDGKRLWSYRRASPYDDVVITTPVVHDGHVFSTVGFGQGCDLVKLAASGAAITAEMVYSNKTIENRDGGVVLVDGHLYGHSENRGWFCMEFKRGKLIWAERGKLGRGSLTYVDGHLICCAEKGGIVALIEASPNGWKEKGRIQLPGESAKRLPNGGMWTHPVVSGGKLYLRDQESLYCYDLK